MLLHAYAIYDVKALVYHSPYFCVSDGVATRMLSNLANDLNTQVGLHPRDFILYNVGGFNDNTGELLPVAPPRHVCDAATLVKRGNQTDFFTRPEPDSEQALNTNGKAT